MGHWYTKDGSRVDFVEGAKGQKVVPDLRHARKLQLAPGVTTIIKCAASEALVQYRERQVLMASQDLGRGSHETDEDFCSRVMRESRKHAEEAALAGTALHAEVEHGLEDPDNTNAWVVAARRVLLEAFGPQRWRSEWCAVNARGFATRADLYAEGDESFVVDIKTKEGPLEDLKTWDEHHMQLAATAAALGLRGARCAILFMRRDEPQARLIEIGRDQRERGWRMFRSLLQYWQDKNNYMPAWAILGAEVP